MRSRRGLTLLEVLIAIFVMGIGLLALLTLFPIGALSMAQAIRDNRCAAAGKNAEEAAKILNLAADVNVVTALTTPPPAGSDVVYVDPLGANFGAAATFGGGGPATPGIVRVQPRNPLPSPPAPPNMPFAEALNWFSILDDMPFREDSGRADATKRVNRYTWGYLAWRVAAGDPTLAVRVLVYANRPLVTPVDENAVTYTCQAAQIGSNVITVTPSGGPWPPPVRAGQWVLARTPGKAECYRVTDVRDVGTGYELELALRLKTPLNPATDRIVVLEYVAEVFDKGPLQPG